MAPAALTELDYDRFYRLFESAVGPDLLLGLCDREGDVLWCSDEARRATLTEALAGRDRETPAHPGQLLYKPIATPADGDVGYLVALPGAAAGGTLPPDQKTARLFGEIGSCVEAEFRLADELNQMAEELSARYEELNLVYSLDERVKEFDIRQGTDVLKRLLADTAAHLGVDAALLILPGEDIQEVHVRSAPGVPAADPVALLAVVQDRFVPGVLGSGAPLIDNEVAGPAAEACGLGAGIRIGAVPVEDGRRAVRGVLAVVARPARANISNSDRKLLEVVAKQVDMLVAAGYDGLTRLLNRVGFDIHCRRVFETRHGPDAAHSLLLVNLDEFKVVNDTCGTVAGDELLVQVAGILRDLTRGADVISRLGSDEFAVLLRDCALADGVKVAEKVRQTIRTRPCAWNEQVLEVSVCIGVAEVDGQSGDVGEYLGYAHAAALVAKSRGPGTIYTYRADDEACAHQFEQMESVPLIQTALNDDRFLLYAQPIVRIGEQGAPHHFEILLRMQADDGAVLGPGAFLGAAERFHLMPKIDRWVVERLFDHIIDTTRREGRPAARYAVNLSGQSLTEDGFLEFLLGQGERLGEWTSWVCFEITETAAIASFMTARHFIGELRKRGFEFSLDDFGSGLSSFSYLHNLPVDYLKIDGSLVKHIATSDVSRVMVSAINQVGQVMRLKTVAEFVENEAILDTLRGIGVDYAQGYLLGKPEPLRRAPGG